MSLFKKRRLSEEEIQAAINRSMDHLHRIRSPEAPGVMRDYLSFTGRYLLENPDKTYIDAHEVCMKTPPEYWPRTLPQKKEQVAYSN